MDKIFEHMVNINKAHGFDILSEQVKELKDENRQMAELLKEFIKWTDKGDEFVSDIREQAQTVLKNRKPYNL